MKTALMILVILIGLILLVMLIAFLLTPWMDKWHTSLEERSIDFPGDGFNLKPVKTINRAVTIQAPPEKIYPWLLQIGADKSGMYSYTWLERLVGCKMAKVEEIRPEWQGLKEGDLMKMCAGDFAPPPYIVAKVIPNESVIFGHREGESWVETWEFRLLPQANGTTRLVTRTRTNMVGGAWEVFNRIAFVMERKMLLTIKSLAEE